MTTATLTLDHGLRKGRRGTLGPSVFAFVLWACLALICAFLFFLLAVIVQKGIARFDLDLVTNQPSKIRPETAGVASALYGTLWVSALTAFIALPLGIAAAVYLEEYAQQNHWWNRMIELNIQNLAAVPTVIYGILVLAFVVRAPLSIGAVVLAGGIALALLILPVVIITTREALRAVPEEIRSGSLALGATLWQTTWRQVLPAAVPGIATGSILALSRAIGEAAPLILVGATTFVTFNPDGVLSRYTTLPVQIFNLVPQDRQEFRDLAYAAILLLILVLLAMNALAIWLRNRYQRRW
ncbi:phosphate ABC transporter permease PstA [Umezawaea endophytica]|uniref:Phosphate transport system permease protein PstA n=1 Tax=Umezawaea endophytica TaxID=1654476 RepID=A0A9X3AJH8_9PSEU|nr:phosphate ABC transporter permease PstA [Umezawaea endophytica]MCS7484592.1 phosphate ABC transporter permease PstA [Umezawaea endophytica]